MVSGVASIQDSASEKGTSMTSDTTTLAKKIALLSSSFALGAFLLSGCSAASTDGATAEATMAPKDAFQIAGKFSDEDSLYRQKLEACLEDHGVKSDRGATSSRDSTASSDVKDSAQSACDDEVGEAPKPTAEQTAARRSFNLALSSCLTDKGHKVPDLKADGQWDDDEMNRLTKSDSTLNPDAMACFKDLAE